MNAMNSSGVWADPQKLLRSLHFTDL